MIRLFSQNETNFDHNDRVLNPLKCIVIEEGNGMFECNVSLPLQDVQVNQILKVPTHRGEQLFRIYRVEKNLYTVELESRHIFYDLLNNFIEDVRPTGNGTVALDSILGATKTPHNFISSSTVGNIATAYFIRQNPVKAIMGSDNSVLNRWGGYLVRDNHHISLIAQGQDKGYQVTLGRNLTGVKDTSDYSEIVTRVYPTYVIDNVVKTLPEKYIDSPLVNSYFMPITREIRVELNEEQSLMSENEIQTYIRDYVNALFENGIDKPIVNYTVNFIQLSQTEQYKDMRLLEELDMYDRVLVNVETLGIFTQAQVIKIEYDSVAERYNKIEIGDFKLSQKYSSAGLQLEVNKKIDAQESQYQLAVKQVTDIIKSSNGGNVITRYNEENQPYEILIMDTTDIETAQKVWRWNINGFAYSSTGINGEYGTAITMDGQIVANFITAGILNADLIKAGRLTLNNTDYIDTSGEFKLGNGAITYSVTNGFQIAQQYQAEDGASAYDIAVSRGFIGTEEQWLASLKGQDGTSVTIKGSKETTDELPTSNNTIGDSWVVDGYLWAWTENGWTNVGRFQGQNGKDGIGYQLILTGDDTLFFNENNSSSTYYLRASVYVNNQNVTTSIPNANFVWRRYSAYPSQDTAFNNQGKTGRNLALSPSDLSTSATYEVELSIPDIQGYLLDNDGNYITDFYGNKIVVNSSVLVFKQQINVSRDLLESFNALSAEITVMQGEINLKASMADIDGNYIASQLNISPSEVKIQSPHLALEGLTTINGKVQITQDGRLVAVDGSFSGVLEANQGIIGGFNIASTGLTKSLQKTFGPFTSTDYNIVTDIVQNKRTPTQEQLNKYDVNGDGRLTSADYVIIAQMINGTRSNPLTITFTALLNTASHLEMMKFYNSLNNMSTTLGTSGVTAQTVECQYFILNGQEFRLDATTGYLKKV